MSINRWVSNHRIYCLLCVACCAVVFLGLCGQLESAPPPVAAKGVKIVFLGTGVPEPNPDRQGPSLAVIVNGRAYLVDAGSGITRQASAAYQRGISALSRDSLQIAFITHLHSDHTLGLPDLILTPWMGGRKDPLQLYGPPGIKKMADNILAAYEADIRIRTIGPQNRNDGYKVVAHEIQPGVVYQDENVRVTAFFVDHQVRSDWWQAFGYRFDAAGKSIVISGDTIPADSVWQACNGCDVLIHEAFTGSGPRQDAGNRQARVGGQAGVHTPSADLGTIAKKAKAKMLVVTHWIRLGGASQDDLLHDIRENYDGPVVIARDLDVVTP